MSRIEKDLLGELNIPDNAYYGVQTQRGIDNFKITGVLLKNYPNFIKGLAYVKWAAAEANCELGRFNSEIKDAIVFACKEIINGKYHEQFLSDMIQGGAGTSTNMNINEVVANVALEKMGHKKGEYQYCDSHDHVNCGQSTNDAYPAAMNIALNLSNNEFLIKLKALADSFRKKADQYRNDLRMGRTHLQDAVPMTFGQFFDAFADGIEIEVKNLKRAAEECLVVNMGATAIGTGLTAIPGYAELVAKKMAAVTGMNITKAANLIESTPDTSDFVSYAGALKRLSIKLCKYMNDLRLLASGPRCGLKEINLPERQPGSSIMPGKVNPVMPESVNQTCYRVIGLETTVAFAAENAQLQLNVMEPVIIYGILESIQILGNSIEGLRERCIDGITINKELSKNMVLNSIGIVTALNPYIGYDNATDVARQALKEDRGVSEIVLERGLLTKDQLEKVLDPDMMTKPSDIMKF